MYRVFLADDEPWVLLGLKNLIDWGSCGFVICGEATDGNKAWERICHLSPDLVLSDIRMPGLDGLALITKIRDAGMDVAVVMISGYSEFEYAREALKLGCADYLLKPVYEEDLEACLKKIKGRLDAGKEKEEEEQEQDSYLSESKVAKEILQYIKEHYREVTQQKLAEVFCMSVSAVSQIIKKHTGKNYSEHLLDIRIKKAQKLLQTTNDSIESIAEQVGYSDYFYFTKVFKKAAGISPSAFRKNL